MTVPRCKIDKSLLVAAGWEKRELGPDRPVREEDEARLFHTLKRFETAIALEYFQRRTVAAGEVLWNEGEPGEQAAFVVDGKVETKKKTGFPGKHVIVGSYGHGSFIGESSLLSDVVCSVTATARTEARLLMLPRHQFERLLAEHPEVGVKLMKSMFQALSIRLRKSFERLAGIF